MLASADRAALLDGWDWAVLGLYFALLLGAAVWFSLRPKANTEQYFLAGRSMPVWAVAISILSTAQSAATFLGAPEQAYAGNLTYLSTNIGGMLAGIVLALVFIPAYYRKGVSTPYQLLTTRFGPGARLATSWAYMLGRVFASGARIYIGSLAVCFAFFGNTDPTNLALSIAAFMVFGIAFTLVGGLTSVIWADVLQVTVYLGAAVAAIVVLLMKIPVGAGEIIGALNTGMPDGSSKLTVVRTGLDAAMPLGFDPAAQFTLMTACTGFVLMTIASHGADQDLVQRMLTCRSPAKGAWSVISGIVVGLPTAAIFMTIGLLLFVFYQRPDLMGRPTPEYAAGGEGFEKFLLFALHEMPPGLAGWVIAGVLAAGPAGINSSLNAMASTLISDVYRPLRPNMSERFYVRAGQWAVVFWGVVLGGFALLCIAWRKSNEQDLITFALSVMTLAYAGLLGVFLTALFTKRGSTRSAIAALVAGFFTVLAFQPAVWRWWTGLIAPDWTDVRIAWPWHLVIGTIVATGVCLLGRPRPKAASQEASA